MGTRVRIRIDRTGPGGVVDPLSTAVVQVSSPSPVAAFARAVLGCLPYLRIDAVGLIRAVREVRRQQKDPGW